MIRTALLEKSVLDVCKLLLDGDDTNPSLLLLVRPFLSRNRNKHLQLLKILRRDYVMSFPKYINPEAPDWLREHLEAENRQEIRIRLKEFRTSIHRIAGDWPKLRQACDKIKSVRDKWIAHFEVECNKVEKKYGPADKTPLITVYRTIEEVVPIVTESVLHLAGIFKSLDAGTDKATELAERDAKEFWEI
jgi:hypothetical protein